MRLIFWSFWCCCIIHISYIQRILNQKYYIRCKWMCKAQIFPIGWNWYSVMHSNRLCRGHFKVPKLVLHIWILYGACIKDTAWFTCSILLLKHIECKFWFMYWIRCYHFRWPSMHFWIWHTIYMGIYKSSSESWLDKVLRSIVQPCVYVCFEQGSSYHHIPSEWCI